MKAWLILTEDEWARLSARDPVRVTSGYYFTRDKNREDIPYNWIKEQVSSRLAPAPSAKRHPIMVYVQWEGKERPDLRTFRHWYPEGERMILVTMAIPDEDLLLADEELWTYVVNHWHIPRDESDANRHENAFAPLPCSIYDSRRLKNARFQEEVIASWDRIFDLTIESDYITSPRGKKSIIGWTWGIPRSSVVQTRSFLGASSWSVWPDGVSPPCREEGDFQEADPMK